MVRDCEKCGTRLNAEEVDEMLDTVDADAVALVCSEDCADELRINLPERFNIAVIEEDDRDPIFRAIDRIDRQIESAKESEEEASGWREKQPAVCHRQGFEAARSILTDEFDVSQSSDEEVRE